MLSLNYVGNHGTYETVQNNGLNAFARPSDFPGGFAGLPSAAPDQRFGVVTQIQSIAVSNYNGLVTSLRRQFDRGLVFQVNYTWSHSLGCYLWFPPNLSSLRFAPDVPSTLLIDHSEHFLHNRQASVASLRCCSPSSRNPVRFPSGIRVHLQRNTHALDARLPAVI